MSLSFLFRVLNCVVVQVFFPLGFWTVVLLTCDDLYHVHQERQLLMNKHGVSK
jgi:hypothetical protein